LQQNVFEIGGNLNSGATTQIGISNSACSGFIIEENDFKLSSSSIPSVAKWGISTNSCGSAPNQIYKNKFNDLNIGNYSVGINRDNNIPSINGLQYICNQNLSNDNFDFLISNKGGGNVGIRLAQGSNFSPAANQFTNLGPIGSFTDFNNTTSQIVKYYYSSGNAPLYFSGVNTQLTTQINNCPSNICTPPCDNTISILRMQQMTNEYDSLETAYLNLLYSYNQLMDGGNTNMLLNQIQSNWSNEAIVLRDELLGLSPYLSQDILRDVANRNILPQAMLLMICLANPDASQSEEFIKFLTYDISNPLPQYMINMIIASWDQRTVRTSMENLLSDFSSNMSNISNKIVFDLYNRTVVDFDSISHSDTSDYNQQINYWLNRVQTLTAKYDLVETYISHDKFENADQVLNSILIDFNLSDDQKIEYEDYIYFYQFRKVVYSNGRNMSQLDNSEVQSLVNFTQGELNFAKGLAQNALCFYYEICREDDYSTNSGNRIAHTSNYQNNKDIVNEAKVNVSPNPAKDIVSFEYLLKESDEQYVLLINDLSGRQIKKFVLNGNEGNLLWDASTCINGLYYYSITTGNVQVANGKISINK
jgi:hypothetical protein